MTTSIFLYPETWDMVVDSRGNIAVCTDEYEIAQNVASACRLWLGEFMYNRNRGIPYKQSVLGRNTDISLLDDWYRTESMTVLGVAECEPYLDIKDRTLTGYLRITTNSGETFNVNV